VSWLAHLPAELPQTGSWWSWGHVLGDVEHDPRFCPRRASGHGMIRFTALQSWVIASSLEVQPESPATEVPSRNGFRSR